MDSWVPDAGVYAMLPFCRIKVKLCVGVLIIHDPWFQEMFLPPPLHRPLIVIGGSSDRNQETMGAFQEFPQVHSLVTFSSVKVLHEMV